MNVVIDGVIWTVYERFALSVDGRFCDLVNCVMYKENGRHMISVNGQGLTIHKLIVLQTDRMGIAI